MLIKQSNKGDTSLIRNGATSQLANRRISGGVTKATGTRNGGIINDYNGFTEYGGSTHLINFRLKQH